MINPYKGEAADIHVFVKGKLVGTLNSFNSAEATDKPKAIGKGGKKNGKSRKRS